MTDHAGVKLLNVSDVHLGALHIQPSDEYDRIRAVVYPLLEEIDILSLSGDFFDNAIFLDDEAAVYGSLILNELFQKAEQYGFAIRIIRGTYTHDRDQLNVAERLAKSYPTVDFKYYRTLAYDEVKGLSGLYVPDELHYSQSELSVILEEHIESTGRTFDFAIVHGYFQHVLPKAVNIGKHLDCYTVEEFQRFVHGPIICGHVHTPSVYKEACWYTGSFDRLAHGEEEAKGCLLFTLGETFSAEFIENSFATPHITVKITHETVEDCLAQVRKAISDRFPNPPFGYLRISGGTIRQLVASVLRNEYGDQLVITDIDPLTKQRSDTTGKLEAARLFVSYDAPVPTPDNVASLLHKYLIGNIDDCPLTLDDVTRGINELSGVGET